MAIQEIDLFTDWPWRLPFWRETGFEKELLPSNMLSGLTISEDTKNVYVEAALPGVDPKDVEITFERGIVWIKGETREEEKAKKYYRKATSSFAYRTTVPAEVDLNAEPQAVQKNGVVKLTFTKSKVSEPKKITVKV